MSGVKGWSGLLVLEVPEQSRSTVTGPAHGNGYKQKRVTHRHRYRWRTSIRGSWRKHYTTCSSGGLSCDLNPGSRGLEWVGLNACVCVLAKVYSCTAKSVLLLNFMTDQAKPAVWLTRRTKRKGVQLRTRSLSLYRSLFICLSRSWPELLMPCDSLG